MRNLKHITPLYLHVFIIKTLQTILVFRTSDRLLEINYH